MYYYYYRLRLMTNAAISAPMQSTTIVTNTPTTIAAFHNRTILCIWTKQLINYLYCLYVQQRSHRWSLRLDSFYNDIEISKKRIKSRKTRNVPWKFVFCFVRIDYLSYLFINRNYYYLLLSLLRWCLALLEMKYPDRNEIARISELKSALNIKQS